MNPAQRREAGVLLHVTSLPPGDIHAQAERFADWAQRAGFAVWQTLPPGPADAQGSPYQPDSACAGNEQLFASDPLPDAAQIAAFAADNADWLDDYALFRALSGAYPERAWTDWPAPLRDRDPAALAAARVEHATAIAATVAAQCRFDLGWQALRARARTHSLRLFGDVPLFVAHHSADVWAQRELFELTVDGRCASVVGVPPDYFSADGQWWGYPPYDWQAMEAEGFAWWQQRFALQARRFDLVRIDHFRGLAAFWRIPADARSAREGEWVPGPGLAALQALAAVLGDTRLVAEDLGVITDDVIALRHSAGMPGMRVLQFAFDGDPRNPHLPAQYEADTVCYTGTHDNDTTLGWWQSLDAAAQSRVRAVIGAGSMPDTLIDYAWASPAPLVIVPMQDLLGLDSRARMNTPGTTAGNWLWRMDSAALDPARAQVLHRRLQAHTRAIATQAKA